MEKVFVEKGEVNESEIVYYLSYYGVIRRDRETIKLRIVYDGLVNLFGRNYFLNDCF